MATGKNKDSKSRVKLALPVGSLNNVERGNTSELLGAAGFEVRGYAPGKESNKPAFENDPEIDAFTDRPQNMPVSLYDSVYDVAILGDDWAFEWQLAGINVERVAALDYGRVRIVFAVKDANPVSSIKQLVESSRKSPVRIRTEYLRIAEQAIGDALKSLGPTYTSGFGPDLITRSSGGSTRKALISIEESFGRTEIGAINGSSIDGIVESVQTGDSLKRAGLRDIGTVFTSAASLYASPYAVMEPAKRKKIMQIADLLQGAVRARSVWYVAFNVPERQLPAVVNYLKGKGYTAKIPTVSVYGGNAAVATVLPKKEYPRIIPELQRLGADDIVKFQTEQLVSSQNGRWQGK